MMLRRRRATTPRCFQDPPHKSHLVVSRNKRNRILSYRWQLPLVPSSRGVFASSRWNPVRPAPPTVRRSARASADYSGWTDGGSHMRKWVGRARLSPGVGPPPGTRLEKATVKNVQQQTKLFLDYLTVKRILSFSFSHFSCFKKKIYKKLLCCGQFF